MTAPTLGRTVLYMLSQDDANAINRRRGARATREKVDLWTLGNQAEAGQVFPAVVVRTWGGTAVNLQIALDGADGLWVTSRTEGTKPGTWSWPSRG